MSSPEDSSAPEPSGAQPDQAFMEEFGRSLQAYQKALSDRNHEQVEAAALEILATAAEHAEKHPTPQLTLQQEASTCLARGDWTGAESCYRQVLALEEPTANFSAITKAHWDLSNLFFLLGNFEKASQSAQAATAAARPAAISVLLVMALENQASCALARSDVPSAVQAASEAVAIVEPGPLQDCARAGAWVMRARCRIASGDWPGGESDLAASKPILLDRATSPILAGWQRRTAAWWEVTARVRANQGDLDGACHAWAEAVRIRRHVASLPHVEGPYALAALARALAGSGEAMEAAGDLENAQAALTEAERIRSELGLPNPEGRIA
jgi:tetratricopeptide (TPR) repeat protein